MKASDLEQTEFAAEPLAKTQMGYKQFQIEGAAFGQKVVFLGQSCVSQ
jgi:hypothetical protein